MSSTISYKIIEGDKASSFHALGISFELKHGEKPITDFIDIKELKINIGDFKVLDENTSSRVSIACKVTEKIEHQIRDFISADISYKLIYGYKEYSDVEDFEVHGLKSFIIGFSSEVDKTCLDIYKLPKSFKHVKLIAKTWLVYHDSETDAAENYNFLLDVKTKNPSEIRFLEINFSKFKSRKDKTNLRDIEIEMIRPTYLNTEQMNLIQFNVEGYPTKKNNIKVAVLDSRIDMEHDCFNQIEIDYINCIDVETSSILKLKDLGSHGTSCASLIGGFQEDAHQEQTFIGLACGVKVLNVQMVQEGDNGNEKYSLATILKALHCSAFEAKVDVISCSWDYPFESPLIKDLVRRITNTQKRYSHKSIPIVFSAGNNRKNTTFPAKMEEVIAVGSVDKNGDFVQPNPSGWYSAEGKIDICAPGNMITAKANNDKKKLVGETGESTSYHNFFGTSCSTPIVAAAIALFKARYQDREFTSDEIKKILISAAYIPESVRWDKARWGPGIISFEKLLNN